MRDVVARDIEALGRDRIGGQVFHWAHGLGGGQIGDRRAACSTGGGRRAALGVEHVAGAARAAKRTRTCRTDTGRRIVVSPLLVRIAYVEALYCWRTEYAAAKTVADAIVEAVTAAKSKLAPARVGYGTTRVDLNVNRDLYNKKLEWRQEPNPDGPSDKTLAVVAFLGNDNVPIGVYLNYAMHPINFYLSGVISADFPGEASRYIEDLFDGKTVAIFSQGASGDQNPRDFRSPTTFMGQRTALTQGRGPFTQTVGNAAVARAQAAPAGFNAQQASAERQAIPRENLDAYKRVIARTGEYAHMLGAMLGSSAVRVMRESIAPTETARIWAAQESFSCPGRIRLDADNPARENVFPGYKDGPDVTLKVGVLRIGDINLATVNGEVYSQIGMRLKAEAPANKTMLVTLANGSAGSGYIYSDEAYSHLSFQVIGSRLKPGCAEDKIVSTAIALMHRSGQ